jgi:hypothetical protein
MKIVRQFLGLSAACLAGVILPIAATVYDGVYRHSHGLADPSWTDRLICNIETTILGSAFVGLIVGFLGVGLLHLVRRSRFRDYALTGIGFGAVSGVLFAAGTHVPADPVESWVIFVTLPALSMTLGFICYWFICVRNHAI